MTTAFFFDERCLWHTTGEHVIIAPVGGYLQPPSGAGHAESPESKRRFKNLVEVSGLAKKLAWPGAEMATLSDLARIHAQDYLDRFRALSDATGGNAGHYSPFGTGSFEIARLSAGLVTAAMRAVWHGEAANAYALSRPPGHHCLPDASMGFCLLANIPIALEALRAEVGPVRVAVLDWDVHHGNGTEAIYLGRADTLTISLHQEACFPVDTGRATMRPPAEAGHSLNVPLLPGGGHQSYLDAFDLLVAPAIRKFAPDLIVIASGFDANAFDPLARMQATSETFRALAGRMTALARDLCGGRLVAAHEGGYAEGYVPFCGLAVLEEFSGIRTAVEDPFLSLLVPQQPAADFQALQTARLQAQARACGLA